MSSLLLLLLAYEINSVVANDEKREFCDNLMCENISRAVCGVKEESGEGVKLRLFESECELLKYGCTVEDEEEYGLINMEYCEKTFPLKTVGSADAAGDCEPHDCDTAPVCAVRPHGGGYKVRPFTSECSMIEYNCENNLDFAVNDSYLCEGMTVNGGNKTNEPKMLFVVDASMFYNGNINKTVDNFFAATHLINMPLQKVDETQVNDTTRRRLVKVLGPVVIYKPWIKVPKNITDDIYHEPLLQTCYHKCPMKCPDTYAPICGNPGMRAREPSLMFKNHCFMDMAQCKMRWEDIGPTAESSAYIDSPFVFCTGERLAHMYLMMPIIRTLQRMGRLKKKAKFHYRLRNMRYINSAVADKVMG